MNKNVKFFAGKASETLAEEIAIAYGSDLSSSDLIEFADGEFEPSFNETVRGADVFLIQSTIPPSDNLMELLLMIDAAKRASAKNIIAVIITFILKDEIVSQDDNMHKFVSLIQRSLQTTCILVKKSFFLTALEMTVL